MSTITKQFKFSEVHQITIQGVNIAPIENAIMDYVNQLRIETGGSFEGRHTTSDIMLVTYDFDMKAVEKKFDIFANAIRHLCGVYGIKMSIDKFKFDTYVDSSPMVNLQWNSVDFDSCMLLMGRKDKFGGKKSHVNMSAYICNKSRDIIKNNMMQHVMETNNYVYTYDGGYEIHVEKNGNIYALVPKGTNKSLATIKKEIENTTGVTITDILSV